MSLWFVFGGQGGIVALRIWAWAQLVSGSSVKRTGLTRKSLTIWSTCIRENRNYCKFMTREHYGSLLMDVSLSQIQCCREMWLDLRPHHFFSCTVLILAGRQFMMLARHWESRLRVLPSHSHTHLDGKCVLAMWQKLVTEIWSTVEKNRDILREKDISQNSKRNATDSNHKLLFRIYLICTWINTFFLPMIINIVLFSFCWEQHQFCTNFYMTDSGESSSTKV